MVDVPAEVARLFTPDVLAKLSRIERRPMPHDSGGWPIRNRHVLLSDTEVRNPVAMLRRDAWWSYIVHAEREGVVTVDVRKRLTSADDDQFRGALAECMCSWYFSTHLDLALQRNTAPEGGADFVAVAHEEVCVEVKAPYVPRSNRTWGGDDADVLRNCVMKAGKQFRSGTTNVVVLVPLLRVPVHEHRDQLVSALVGEYAWRYTISTETGALARDVEDVFLQNGKLAKLRTKPDGDVSTDLTRVSAVVSLETAAGFRDQPDLTLEYEVCVVHNPFAAKPLRRDVFGRHPQLLPYGEGLAWSDRTAPT